jgi:hypothetical protein
MVYTFGEWFKKLETKEEGGNIVYLKRCLFKFSISFINVLIQANH